MCALNLFPGGTMALIIIIGRGHSGTRAISRTLRESGVFMGAQLNQSDDLVPAEDMYEACRVFARHVKHIDGLHWDFSDALSMDIPHEFTRLVHSYARSVLESDAEYRGWKLPETTLVLPWILHMYPDAYYIYWVRDPRDSIIGRHLTDDLADFGVPYEKTPDERERRAVSWKYQREIVAATPQPKRWLQVRFEDFVLDQEAQLKRLERFLGLPLVRIPVKPEAVGRWRNDTERHDFNFLRKDMAELGYTEHDVVEAGIN
jgi:hypothetical protein